MRLSQPLLTNVLLYQHDKKMNKLGRTGYRLYASIDVLKQYQEILANQFNLYSHSPNVQGNQSYKKIEPLLYRND